MTKSPLLLAWFLLFCWLLIGGGEAWARGQTAQGQAAQQEQKPEQKPEKKPGKRTGKKAKKAAPESSPAPEAAAPLKLTATERPESLLSRAQEQEKAGDISGCLQTLGKFVNLFPRHAERAAILFRMAQLARENRQPDRALTTYSLAASLYPDSRMAAEARCQVYALEFYHDLRNSNPLAAFRDYLRKIASLPGEVTPAQLREPLRLGWQEVAGVVRAKSPCPVHLVEETLALWELHPEGAHPPEAALLIGELLLEKGLYAESRSYLQWAREQGAPDVRTQALVGLLEGAWALRDLPEFAAAWILWRRNQGAVTPVLQSRLEKLPLAGGGNFDAPGPGQGKRAEEDAVAALLDWWNGKSPDGSRQAAMIQCLEHFLRGSQPRAVKERLQLQLAQLQWSQGNFSQAARNYQELLNAARGENVAFYRDRLALSQLKGQRPEAAVEIFQGLSQEKDNLWRLLSRARLADVELGRLQTEPPQ